MDDVPLSIGAFYSSNLEVGLQETGVVMAFNQSAFNDFLLEHDVVGFFEKPIHLKSERISHWYANWRHVSSDAYLLDQLSDFVVSFLRDQFLNIESILGVPEGASKVGILSSYKWAKLQGTLKKGSHVIPMGRAMPKAHGDAKDRFFVGSPVGPTVVLEDVTTTGMSVMGLLDHMKTAELSMVGVVTLFDRMEIRDDGLKVPQKIKEKYGLPFLAMSRADEILPRALKRYAPSESVVTSVMADVKQYRQGAHV